MNSVLLQRSCIHVKLKNKTFPGTISHVSWLEHHFAHKLYSFAQTMVAFQYLVKDSDNHPHLFVSSIPHMYVTYIARVQVWMLNVCCKLTCNANPKVFSKFTGELKTHYTQFLCKNGVLNLHKGSCYIEQITVIMSMLQVMESREVVGVGQH